MSVLVGVSTGRAHRSIYGGAKGWCLDLAFPIWYIELRAGSPDRYNGTYGLFAAFFWLLTVCTYLFRWTFDLQRILFSGFYGLGKPPEWARLASILMTMTLIFVKHRGAATETPVPPVIQPDLDMALINNRFMKFKSLTSRKPYQKQKSALEQQLSNFIAALTPPKDIYLSPRPRISLLIISSLYRPCQWRKPCLALAGKRILGKSRQVLQLRQSRRFLEV